MKSIFKTHTQSFDMNARQVKSGEQVTFVGLPKMLLEIGDWPGTLFVKSLLACQPAILEHILKHDIFI